jgi:Uma2 family endonuclease
MSTTTSRVRSSADPTLSRPPRLDQSDHRIVISAVEWDLYDRLSEAIGERQHVRLAYDGEDLEIMTTGRLHEDYKELLGQIVGTVSKILGIPRSKLGETTWKRPEIARGIQADQCYYFVAEKLAADKAARARKSNVVADYPNPDLAIEIDLSDPQVDRSGIYAALRVAEVWRFDGESLVIEQLRDDGSYVTAEASRFLPLRAADILRWLVEEDSGDQIAWERRLDAWARALRRGRRKGPRGTRP